MGHILIVGGGREVKRIIALASGAFDHLNCKHTRKFDQNFSKKKKNIRFQDVCPVGRGGRGAWAVWKMTEVVYLSKVETCLPVLII